MSNLLEKAKELKIDKPPEESPKESIIKEPKLKPETSKEKFRKYSPPSTTWYTQWSYTSGNDYTTTVTVPATSWTISPISTTITYVNTSVWSI
jgi:hypothetical protein